jgi:hypothetical protein
MIICETHGNMYKTIPSGFELIDSIDIYICIRRGSIRFFIVSHEDLLQKRGNQSSWAHTVGTESQGAPVAGLVGKTSEAQLSQKIMKGFLLKWQRRMAAPQ